MNWRQTLITLCLLAAPAWSAALGLELKSLPLGTSASVQAVFMEGVLQDGDGQKFQQFLANLEPATEQSTLWIALNSEGGSVREALNIARQIRNRGFITHVPADSRCISACLFLYAAGLIRVPGLTPPNTPFKPNIGIHRAFISRDFLARLSLSQAQDLTRAMYQSLERAFREFDIPPAIYQNALMTSSSQVRWLTEAETRSLGTYPAWFDEYLLARCDQLQTAEVARDTTARTREKSACAMRVIQAHRRQVSAAAPTAPPPAAD
jgi:hypothetical protein